MCVYNIHLHLLHLIRVIKYFFIRTLRYVSVQAGSHHPSLYIHGSLTIVTCKILKNKKSLSNPKGNQFKNEDFLTKNIFAIKNLSVFQKIIFFIRPKKIIFIIRRSSRRPQRRAKYFLFFLYYFFNGK